MEWTFTTSQSRSKPCGNYGDADQNGVINENDVNYAFSNLSSLALDIIDVNANGNKDYDDVVKINEYVVARINTFTACTVITNGVCGSSNGGTFSTAPSTNLCSAGNASSVTTNTTTYTWSCNGINGGTTANCSANRVVNGVCGSSNGGTFSTAPSTNLCSAGNASSVTTNPTTYTWNCNGINGGTTSNCSSNRLTDGTCGSAAGTYTSTSPSTNLCSAGSPTSVNYYAPSYCSDSSCNNNNWGWSCQPVNGGTISSGCGAYLPATCGSANGGSYSSAPPDGNLCSVGYYATFVCPSCTPNHTLTSDASHWYWSCTWASSSVNCSATKLTPVDGTCGTANGHIFASTDSSWTPYTQCATGTPSSTTFPSIGGSANWTCSGINGGATSPTCSASRTVGLSCGSSHNTIKKDQPSTNLCVSSTNTALVLNSNIWYWNCENSPEVPAACYTYKTSCGSANGSSFVDPPEENLCTYGTASSVTTTTTYNWTCTGNDSLTVSCSASLTPVNGTCGTANGHIFSSSDSEWGVYTQCENGNPSSTTFPSIGGSANWTCSGVNGGSTSSTCTATRSSVKYRQYYYSESTALSTWNTNTDYQDKTTLTFIPDPNSTYLIIASWLMNESSVSYGVQGKLTRTTGTVKDFSELIYMPKDPSDYISGGAIGIDSFGSSPEAQTYKIQYKTNNTAAIGRIKDAKIIAIKMNSADQYAQLETRATTNSTAYVDSANLTFTPSTAGDYIIIATADLDGANNTVDFRAQLNIDSSIYSNYNIETFNPINKYLWGMVKKVNLTAASHTIKIQYSTENASYAAGIANARIIALRADEFNNNYYDSAEGRLTTTLTSYTNYLALTQTTQESNHLIIGCAGIDGANASYSSYVQLSKDGAGYGESLIETRDITNRGYPYFTIKKESLTNSQSIWRMQYRAENASYAAGINNARIAVLELMPDPIITISSTGTQIANVNKNTTDNYIGGAFTFQSNLGSVNLNQITISETGTIDANANLSNLKLYYETAATCNYDGDETLFGTAASFDSSQKAIITGIMPIVSSRVCIYPVLDIASGATAAQTIELEISNISTEVILSYGTINGTSPVQINGTSTISNLINGSCGLSDGQSFSSAPTENLCAEGNATGVLGTGPWTWTCTGIDGGTTANCSANKMIVGSCGTAEKTYASADTSYGTDTFCATGTASPINPAFPPQGGSESWSCIGSSSSWLSGWLKRKPVTVSSSASLTDYQVRIDATYDSDMLDSFNDIRFTLSDGVTELNYWNESVNTGVSATFWVKIPSLSLGDNTIYMYYGNTSVSTTSNGINTFEFFDDFNRANSSDVGNDWVEDVNIFSIENNMLKGSSIGGTTDTGIYKNHTFGSNYVLETRMKAGSTGSGSVYQVRAFRNATNTRSTAAFRSGNINYLNSSDWGVLQSYTADQWYKFKIIDNGSSHGLYVDGGSSLTGISYYNWSITNRIEFSAYSVTGNFYSDWIFVRKYTSSEPTISLGEEDSDLASVSCTASRLESGPSAENLKAPIDINSDDSCWYCTHYYVNPLDATTITSGRNADLEFQFTYTDSNPLATITSYKFVLDNADNVNSPNLVETDWISTSGAVDSVITYNKNTASYGVSVKNNPTLSGQISYNGIYYWWVKVKNNSSQESEWIKYSGTLSTPSHHYPIVRIVADKSIATIGSDIRYCSTVSTIGGVINTSDPCYPICWTPATGTPVLDPDDSRWKCSICYDSSTNAPVLCGTGAGTGNNTFAWTMPTTVGVTYQESTTSSSLNTVVKYDGIEIALKPRLKITGSECGGEGEGTLSIPILPKWREINP